MLKIGLTGSIAVGKSFVLEVFRELGCRVLDADQTARDVVEPGEPAFDQIIQAFGPDIVGFDGRLDRKKLGAIVFNNIAKRELLNSIVHPRVIAIQDRWLADIEKHEPKAIAIVDAALMIESGGYKRFEKVIVVWCEPDIQLARLMSRNVLAENEARSRIAAQMPQEEKKRFADLLIDTSRGHQSTRDQVVEIFSELKLLTERQER